MARLKGVFQEVMELISANTSIDYVRVWNDQLASMEKDMLHSRTACFVEIDLPKESLGLGYVGGILLCVSTLYTQNSMQWTAPWSRI